MCVWSGKIGGEKNKAAKVYVESAVNCAGLLFSHSSPCLWCPLATALVEFGSIIVCSLPPSPSLRPSDCNRSCSLPALSMQALPHAVRSLSAISKCHRLLQFFFPIDRVRKKSKSKMNMRKQRKKFTLMRGGDEGINTLGTFKPSAAAS